jgi:hypothetical protein
MKVLGGVLGLVVVACPVRVTPRGPSVGGLPPRGGRRVSASPTTNQAAPRSTFDVVAVRGARGGIAFVGSLGWLGTAVGTQVLYATPCHLAECGACGVQTAVLMALEGCSDSDATAKVLSSSS